MLRTAQLLPLEGLLTLHFDAGRFPPTPTACYRALTVTRTGLSPAGDDELQTESDHVTIGVTPFGRWAYSLLSWIFRRPVMLDQLDTAQVAKQDILGG